MKKRVTVDFDEESYYLDGEYWTSWDHYGEEMAEKINELLNKQDKTIKDRDALIKAKNQQLDDVKRILYKFQDYDHDLIESILNELGWD